MGPAAAGEGVVGRRNRNGAEAQKGDETPASGQRRFGGIAGAGGVGGGADVGSASGRVRCSESVAAGSAEPGRPTGAGQNFGRSRPSRIRCVRFSSRK